jgi:hypothetical protein
VFKTRYSCVIPLVSIACFATTAAETTAEIKNRVLTETKLVAVMGLSVPSAEYKGDGDPSTLEMVFLEKESDGPSRVSEDGEVIFLYNASSKTQEQLIERAFDIRIARASSGT